MSSTERLDDSFVTELRAATTSLARKFEAHAHLREAAQQLHVLAQQIANGQTANYLHFPATDLRFCCWPQRDLPAADNPDLVTCPACRRLGEYILGDDGRAYRPNKT